MMLAPVFPVEPQRQPVSAVAGISPSNGGDFANATMSMLTPSPGDVRGAARTRPMTVIKRQEELLAVSLCPEPVDSAISQDYRCFSAHGAHPVRGKGQA